MDWTNISEGIISGIVATLVSSVILWVFSKIVSPKLKSDDKKGEQIDLKLKTWYKNPFLLSLFLTSFLGVITFFSFMFQWQGAFNYVYLLVGAVILGIITERIYHNQCPNCNRIFTKKLINKETMKQEKRPYYYRDEIIYYYSDGETVKDRKFVGKEKKRMETWRLEKEFYKCNACQHEWDEVFERNLDLQSRPKPTKRRTKFKVPKDDFGF